MVRNADEDLQRVGQGGDDTIRMESELGER